MGFAMIDRSSFPKKARLTDARKNCAFFSATPRQARLVLAAFRRYRRFSAGSTADFILRKKMPGLFLRLACSLFLSLSLNIFLRLQRRGKERKRMAHSQGNDNPQKRQPRKWLATLWLSGTLFVLRVGCFLCSLTFRSDTKLLSLPRHDPEMKRFRADCLKGARKMSASASMRQTLLRNSGWAASP